jgi:hypothetical protein
MDVQLARKIYTEERVMLIALIELLMEKGIVTHGDIPTLMKRSSQCISDLLESKDIKIRRHAASVETGVRHFFSAFRL